MLSLFKEFYALQDVSKVCPCSDPFFPCLSPTPSATTHTQSGQLDFSVPPDMAVSRSFFSEISSFLFKNFQLSFQTQPMSVSIYESPYFGSRGGRRKESSSTDAVLELGFRVLGEEISQGRAFKREGLLS